MNNIFNNKPPCFVRWINSDASSAVQEANNRFKSLVFLRWIFLLLTLFCLQPVFATPTTPTSDFIDNGDGTVTHKTTGLTWMRCAMGITWTGSTCSGTTSTYTYDQAVTLKSNFAGHGDWRLPNIAELHTIVERDDLNFETNNPVINTTIFPNTPRTFFWSSSPHADSTSFTWIVNFESSSGFDGFGTKYHKHAVRLVRGGQSFGSLSFTTPSSDFTNNNDGTVTHKRTGLTWQRCSVGQTWTGSSCSGTAKHYNYGQAITLTSEQAVTLTSNFAGYNDWRVPNQNELLSIVEYGTYNPAINPTLFPNTPSDYFLSSSPYRGSAWIVDFSHGQGGYYISSSDEVTCVRLVRGQSVIKQPENPAKTPVHITAKALGHSWQDQDFTIYVPWSDFDPIKINVIFDATSQDLSTSSVIGETILQPKKTDSFVFGWQIDGGKPTHGARFSPMLEPGEYKIKLCAMDKRYINNVSIPLITQLTCTYSSQVKVTVKKKPDWNCLGRMGVNCGDDKKKTVGIWVCGPSTLDAPYVQQGCDGADNTFCIYAWASVGSIKHDLCCEKYHDDGFMCKNEPKGTNCELEWTHAMLDFELQKEFSKGQDLKAATLFEHKWKYFFNSSGNTSYEPTSGETDWWKGMLPSGDVIIGYHVGGMNPRYIPGDKFEYAQFEYAQSCPGGKVEGIIQAPPILVAPYLNAKFPLYPYCEVFFPNSLFPPGMSIDTVYVCKNTRGDRPPLVNPQGKSDTVGKKITPAVKSKDKKVTRAGCNKGSSVSSPRTGSAEGALKKYGTGTDGCAQ